MSTTQPPKPQRRWYQFSLRTLLVVMLIATVVVGWIGIRVRGARENRDRVAVARKGMRETEAVVEIEKLGGSVKIRKERLRPQTWLEKRFDDPGSVDDPVHVYKFFSVSFWQTRGLITDADLEHLRELKNLEELYLDGTQVTDAGLEQLKGLTKLQNLNLTGTKVTDAGLEHLKGLKRLQLLQVQGTRITDAGVEKLQQALPNCEIIR